MNPGRTQAILDTAWQAISSTVTAPLRLVSGMAMVGTHRRGKRLDASDRSDPERLRRVLSLLGPFFERELLCVIGAGDGPLCAAGIMLEGFQRIVATEHDPKHFALLNVNLLLNHLGDRVTALHARCGAPQHDSEGTGTQGFWLAAPGEETIAAQSLTQTITVDRLLRWATPGSALVWISARSLHQDTLEGARALIQRGVPLLVGLPRPGPADAAVYESLHATSSSARYTHCYRIGPGEHVAAIDHHELARLLRRPEAQNGSTDLLFF